MLLLLLLLNVVIRLGFCTQVGFVIPEIHENHPRIVEKNWFLSTVEIDRESGVCRINTAVVSAFYMILFVNPDMHEDDLSALRSVWDAFVVYATDEMEPENPYYFRNSAANWVRADHMKEKFPPPVMKHSSIIITNEDWLDFLVDMTDCFASFYDGHKIVNMFMGRFPKEVRLAKKSATPAALRPFSYPGKTFLFNAAIDLHHHGHFAMKSFQFFSALQSPFNHANPQIGMKNISFSDFANLVFQDFPVLPRKSGSWVDTIWSIMMKAGSRNSQCYTTHILWHSSKYKECVSPQSDIIEHSPLLIGTGDKKMRAEGVPDDPVVDYYWALYKRKFTTHETYFEDIYFQSSYQRPFPYDNSKDVWRKSLLASGFVNNNPGLKKALNRHEKGPGDINILWIERMEGENGHRAVLNKEEVLYYAKEVFPQATITELQIDSNVPVSVQATLFANASLVLCSHGSHLWNMVFSRPGTAIVELFGVWYSREFKVYGQALGLNYQIQWWGNALYGKKGLESNIYMSPTLNTPGSSSDFIVSTKAALEYFGNAKVAIDSLIENNNRNC